MPAGNREARRIGESQRKPGRPAEQFQEMMSFRRADASEASLCEFPIEHVVRSGETIRAEEMLVSVPDGRSVRVLVNATPIPTEGDAVSSVVVTFQDQAPIHEIERLRTEFLGLVGHELREPLAAIRGSALDAAGGRGPRQGAGFGRGRLYRQAVLADRAGATGAHPRRARRRAHARPAALLCVILL